MGIYLDQKVWNVIQFVFVVCPNSGLQKYIKSKVLIAWFYFIWSFFKTKRLLGLVFLHHFLHDFWRKMFVTLYFFNWSNFFDWFPLLLEIFEKYVYCYYLLSNLWHHKFWNKTLAFLSNHFPVWPKSQGKEKKEKI